MNQEGAVIVLAHNNITITIIIIIIILVIIICNVVGRVIHVGTWLIILGSTDR